MSSSISIASGKRGRAASGPASWVRFGDHVAPEYAAFSPMFPLLWVLALWFSGAYDERYIGIGSDEFRRVLNAGVSLTAGLAVLSYAVATELSLAYLIVRWVRRKRLQVARGPPVAQRSAPIFSRRSSLVSSSVIRARSANSVGKVLVILGESGAY